MSNVATAGQGIAIEAGGTINKTVETTLDPDWDLDNLYLVAFVHRDGKLGGKRMHVFNTAVGEIAEATGIVTIEHSPLNIEHSVYDLQGRRLNNSQFIIHNSQLPKGVYIVGGKKVVLK